MTSQIATGLAHAHSRGVVHRDIKPANLILTSSGQVKIVDFGIAVLPEASRLTREGVVVGTMAYMSPEQILGRHLDHRTDLWSLGVVLYELLTGRLPFDSGDDSYAAAVLSQEPAPVTVLRPGLPSGITGLLSRLLAKDRAGRYQQAYEVAEDVQILRSGGIELRPLLVSTGPTTLLSPPVHWADPVPSPIPEVHPRVADVFVGRQQELALLRAHLLVERPDIVPNIIAAIQGMPGVGKSFLADRFALDHTGQFPGGYVRLVLDPKAPNDPDTLLESVADQLKVPGGPDLPGRVRGRLRHSRTLLHIENVDSPTAEITAGQFLQKLSGVTAIVTGRLHDLGLALGWVQIRVVAFDEETSLQQLWGELGWEPVSYDDPSYRELVRRLGYLPLAIHLAAGHLRSGRSAAGFLKMLRQRGLDLAPANRAELAIGVSESARQVLATSFAISLEILREEVGPDADRLITGLQALGHAPLSGFGRSLGAYLAGLPDEDFEELVFHAQKLGLLLPVSRKERPDGAWSIHPLLADFFSASSEAELVTERMTDWFLARMPEGKPGHEADQGQRWREVENESAALRHWVPRIAHSDSSRVVENAMDYAYQNGPFHVWIEFCESALRDTTDSREQSSLLYFLSAMALRHGRYDQALNVAQEKLALDSDRGDEYEMSLAYSAIGGALQGSGSFDEALDVWLHRQIPILERLGNDKERAVTLSRAARILKLRERFDEALHLLREEVLPVFERIQDVRSRAVLQGMIADIFEARGELEPALKLRQFEELPIYEMLGETRSKAVTIGKIASILRAQGELDEALKILEEEQKPILKKLGDMREIALCFGRIADVLCSMGRIEEAIQVRKYEQIPILYHLGSTYDLVFAQEHLALLYLERQDPEDREAATELLQRALESADRLQLPVADRIRALLEWQQELGEP